MSPKVISTSLLFFALIFVSSSAVNKKIPSSDDDDDDFGGISLGSQQDSQSSQENLGSKESRDGAAGLQQHHQSQQQLAAKIGNKHYILQQQLSLGQQLAKLGKKTAIQQLADSQKQAISNGEVKKHSETKTQEGVHEDQGAIGGVVKGGDAINVKQ